jgi:phosphopantothenate---cysteine ligase (CTP)
MPAMRFLVTAGNTREMIDRVRDWGNIFTGNTGFAIARALASVGQVDLLTSNPSHLTQLAGEQSTQYPICASAFGSHAELKGALSALLSRNRYDAIFMTAAVSDYRPVRTFSVIERKPDMLDATCEQWVVQDVQAGKVKSTHKLLAVLGEPTEKLVDLFRTQWGHRGLLIKFKLEVGVETDVLLKIAEQSRVSSGADFLVANTLEMINGPAAGAYLLHEGSHEWIARADLASRMVELVQAKSP